MSTKPNQFRSLIAASGQAPVAQANTPVAIDEVPRKARKLGKRTAPDYVQVGVYIPKKLHHEAKVLLIREGGNRDFSQLIGDLLAEYALTRTSG
jgi:hypothetical protein